MTTKEAEAWQARAIAAERGGNRAAALELVREGLEKHPGDAALANTAGNIAMRAGDFALAANRFAAAARLRGGELDYAVNHAIALNRLERFVEARTVLAPLGDAGRRDARYCSVRGIAERGAGNLPAAARWFDMCLAIDPRQPRALHGRARLALERGEADAPARFDAALAVNSSDPDVWLGKAQALDVAGRSEEARSLAEQIVAQGPGWSHGTRFLAQLRLAAGEADFASHYADAARRQPGDPSIRTAWAEQLAAVDRHAEAAEVLAEARRDFPQEERLILLEAIAAGADGQAERARGLFAKLALHTPERHLHEARQALRDGEADRAERLLGQVTADEPSNIAAWALRDIAWRIQDDPRHGWLHGQEGLVQLVPLDGDATLAPELVSLLDRLHDNSAFPLGQSLRGGTQTRGILFDRIEPQLAKLRAAIERTLEHYRRRLPSPDAEHPLLSHADAPWRLAGSWSVRLSGGGDHHTSHLHPQGLLSSALYIRLPDRAAQSEGVLELGRPPVDLRLDLPPIATVQPQIGHLALFPSTLYHGTSSFTAGSRMTVAFDVATGNGPSQ